MSYLNTKLALIQKLQNATITGITADDIAWENNNFDPSGKSQYIACYFIPAVTESLGKTLASSDQQEGIFQISVFISLDGGEYDHNQLQIVDDVLSEFQYSTSSVYNGQTVEILESTLNAGSENESWFKRDLSINYLTFSER